MVLFGCGDDGTAIPPADRLEDALVHDDGGLPDSGADSTVPPLRPCTELVLRSGPVNVLRCPDGAHITLSYDRTPVIERATVAVSLDGEHRTAADWPMATWRKLDAAQAVVRFGGRDDAPDLEWRLVLAEGLLEVVVNVEPTIDPGKAGSVSSLSPLWVSPPGTVLIEPEFDRSTWRVWAGDGDLRIAPDGPLRVYDEQIITGRSRHLAIAGTDVARGRLAITLDPGTARYGLDHLSASSVGSPRPRVAGTRIISPAVAMGVDTDPGVLAARIGARIALRTGTERRPGWGWQTETTIDAVELARLEARSESFGVPGWVIVEGRWYATIGDWTPRVDITGAVQLVTDAGLKLAVSWPLLDVTTDGGLFTESPDWIATDDDGEVAQCASGVADCARLDPAQPGVRDHLARVARALAAAGVDCAVGTGLPPGAASASPEGRLWAAPLDPARAWLGIADAIALPARPAAAGVADMARAAARVAHLAPHVAIYPGPVHVAPPRTAGEARQAAAIAGLLGGLYLLGDPPGELDDARWAIYVAPLEAGLLSAGPAVPDDVFEARETPPTRWRIPGRALALFNWTNAPLRFDAPIASAPGLERVRRLFDPDAPVVALSDITALEVPAHDVVVLVGVIE